MSKAIYELSTPTKLTSYFSKAKIEGTTSSIEVQISK
jgi:hypothetical protein